MNTKRKVKIMSVTPEVAARWLNESNTHNRPIRNGAVERLAAAMKRGEWRLTAEPIAFSGPYKDECDEPRRASPSSTASTAFGPSSKAASPWR